MKSHGEFEVTYAPGDSTALPDLTGVDGVDAARPAPALAQSAVYFDTTDLALLTAGVSLWRRTGDAGEGWHLTVPAGARRDEIQRPLGRSTATPPKALRDLVAGWARGARLVPVATVGTDRSPILLLDRDGRILAQFTDDRVVGTTDEGVVVSWREWKLQLVDGGADLFHAADRRLAALGVNRAEVAHEPSRVLDARRPPANRLRAPKADKPVSRLVHARLVAQVDALARREVDARRGTEEGVHKMRVACRRLRALLGTFRPVLDRDLTDPVREELRWLAGVLGTARDAAVVHERLRRLVADEPRTLVHGPVLGRLRSTLAGRGLPELRAALDSQRYFDLRDRLDRLAGDPPWTELADAAAREVAPQALRKELKRFRRAVRDTTTSEDPAEALHDARKAAKRLRYAAETVEPIAGKAARRLDRAAQRVTSHLGELQDSAVSRTELLALAMAAAAANEPTFTYGRLHAREEARASQLAATLPLRDALGGLTARTRAARKAAGHELTRRIPQWFRRSAVQPVVAGSDGGVRVVGEEAVDAGVEERGDLRVHVAVGGGVGADAEVGRHELVLVADREHHDLAGRPGARRARRGWACSSRRSPGRGGAPAPCWVRPSRRTARSTAARSG